MINVGKFTGKTKFVWKPQCTVLMISSTLIVSPTVLMVSSCTEHPPVYSCYLQCTEQSLVYSVIFPSVLNTPGVINDIPQCTEHPPVYCTSPVYCTDIMQGGHGLDALRVKRISVVGYISIEKEFSPSWSL